MRFCGTVGPEVTSQQYRYPSGSHRCKGLRLCGYAIVYELNTVLCGWILGLFPASAIISNNNCNEQPFTSSSSIFASVCSVPTSGVAGSKALCKIYAQSAGLDLNFSCVSSLLVCFGFTTYNLASELL